jgi:predicted AAA+ superfamily ATPase
MEDILFKGCYPRIYADSISPTDWYPNYIRTYVERDVRQIQQVADLSVFQRFLKLCAGRIGQLVNLVSLGNDCGIDSRTVNSWLSILEASYIIFLFRPHHNNLSKRLIKAPKLYFYDTGLACSLLGIESVTQLPTHYLRGGLFESLIISDLIKQRYNAGALSNVYFWRDIAGNEIDCNIDRADDAIPVEIKAGKTIINSYFDGVRYWSELAKKDLAKSIVIYAGDDEQQRSHGRVLGWRSVSRVMEKKA